VRAIAVIASLFVLPTCSAEGAPVRWERAEVTVSLHGNVTETDRFVLASFLEEANDIVGVPRLLLLAHGPSDIEVHFLPRSLWSSVWGADATDDSVEGRARYTYRANVILESKIVVNSSAPQIKRNRTIVHEMLHALGLAYHSCPGGLLHGGGDYDPDWAMGEFDSTLLRARYARQSDPPRAGSDTCPPVRWRTTEIDGELLWCAVRDGSCYRVDERLGVRADEHPRWWLVDGAAYDHNPATHAVFTHRDRRILCELRPASALSPCQFTHGTVLTGTDLYVYADGERRDPAP